MKILAALIKKSYVNNTGWLPNGFIERNCQGDWR